MGHTSTEIPIHDSLNVSKATNLYHTEEWWKAIVTYQFEDSDTDEVAVYLWHKDGDWNRKNKYVVKTSAAWETDKEIIDQYVRDDSSSGQTNAFPASDYYTVADGETVSKGDGWWKAIVRVVEKGNYETNEVMVYVWQNVDDQWRRRQKYTIKSVSDWEEEREIIEDHLSSKPTSSDVEEDAGDSRNNTDDEVSEGLRELSSELDEHISEEFRS